MFGFVGIAFPYTCLETCLNSPTLTTPLASPRQRACDAPVLDASPDSIAGAYAHCAHVVRTRARNFYHGLKLTPEPRRSAIYSIYAWMRMGDDAVDADAPVAERRVALERFRDATERLLHGRLPGDEPSPVWLALAVTLAAYPVDSRILRDMLAGLEEDLDQAAYRTDDDLARYCYRVAGTAGLACMSIWGYREDLPDAEVVRGRALAERLGQAFQRTNILRDFAEDFDAAPRRVYLPQEAFDRHGVTPAQLRDWAEPARCAVLVSEQARIARQHYAAGAELESMVDPACRPTLWAMTRIYSSLLAIIEADPSRIVRGGRVRLAGTRKVGIALRAAAAARLARGAREVRST